VDQAEQALFERFMAPLTPYVALGGRQEAVEKLARNLWIAMLSGPKVEEAFWETMRKTAGLDADLFELIQRCYFEEMKPVVGEEQLAALRKRYGIQSEDDPAR